MTLPIPDLAALTHSKALIAHILQIIENSNGYISFARFMELALYTPGLGYYTAGAYKFGPGGDFITAPEISPLFGRSIARQCQQILNDLGYGDILELGAGSGVFAKDLLLELDALDKLPKHYYILEVSADLRERQQQLLKSSCPPYLFERFIWLDALPQKFIGIILANEVIDAMPVNCFKITAEGIQERCVTSENDYFAWQLAPPTNMDLAKQAELIQAEYNLPVGYASEINLMIAPWIRSLAETLKCGAILLLDYGYGRQEYYHPDRDQGTLTCFYRHHHHNDPFVNVGLQDITAHVDFTSVIESGVNAGLSLAGFTSQAGFLLACGLLELAAAETLNEVEQYKQNQAIKTLTLPSQMGELVKVMALTKEVEIPLLGFSLQDRRREL